MARKLGVRQVTEFVIGAGWLAFIATVGVILFLVLIMLGNFILYALAHVIDKLFDLFRATFGA